MADAQSEVEIMDGLLHDMQFACSIQDNATADRVYARFMSVLEPGVVSAAAMPWPTGQEEEGRCPLGKRKTGVADAKSAVEIMQELCDDMQTACDKQDSTA